ncbi:IPT/TIG domain-containing protein, partial [Legionella lytica]
SGALAVNVVVNNGVSNAVLSGGFTYQPAAPTLVSISPNSGSMAGGTAVTVSGTNFTPTTTLTIGGLAATSVTVVNATTLTAVTPAYVSGSLVKNVVISNSAGSATLTSGYTYVAIAPTITNVNPTSGPMAGGTSITITGTNFTPTTTVSVGGVSATSVVVANATTLTALTPAYVSGSLTKDITINNGNSNATLSSSFTYIAPAPTLVSIAPTSGTTGGGTSITLNGTGFTPGTTVTIGSVAATNVSVVNSTTLTATTPAYVSGALVQSVSVNNGVGTASLLNAFTYIASAPTITSIVPTSGTSSGGTSVTISGSNFIPGTTVTIGGQATTSTSVVNANTITAVTPAYTSGSLTVNVVVNNTISTATLTNGYTYIAVTPNITSCNYPGGILTTAWVCVGTNMNVFPNTFLNIRGGLLCTAGVSITGIVATVTNALNLGGNSLLPGLYSGCSVQLCNNSTCTGINSNIVAFS